MNNTQVIISQIKKTLCLAIRTEGSLYPVIYLKKPKYLDDDIYKEVLYALLVDREKIDNLIKKHNDWFCKEEYLNHNTNNEPNLNIKAHEEKQ